MPTYTYRCTKCGTEIEVTQAMSDPPLKRCRKCKGALRRTFHPVGIVLKGSGFHRTDYRSTSGSKRPSESSESSEAASSETKEKETEAKKEPAKTEKKPASGS